MNTLTGKIALVTGGNSGIGYAAAKELKDQGAEVLITGRRKEAVELAANELGVTGHVTDQGQLAAIDELAAFVKGTYGKLDILFINAGIVGGASIEQTTEEAFDTVMNINFKGAYFTLSKFIPLLHDGASVVFLSSNTARMDGANSSVYSSSKAAINSIMRIAAVELAPRHIRVNSISPGPTQTEIMKKVGYSDEQLLQLNDWMIDRVPLKKLGQAEDVGKLVAYFSSDAARFITGAELVVDGGMSLKY
ncbi:SDR family oxidoreductase [Spirosoma sp. KNUC1025]|uniref:SDR family oxidoreductase n=1 Tax=Spirosoma sp. KNUC1025 TaxID=2894082 RepID=UPI001E4EC951|nr:SDR family oxidoreductase [Spirosoma sp. KNUC1025]UFH57729.1 SDR family oxidoreductase [Spirosoma sp. KNUC1025]